MMFRGNVYYSAQEFTGKPRNMLCWNTNDTEPVQAHVIAYSKDAHVFITDDNGSITLYERAQDFGHGEPEAIENEYIERLSELNAKIEKEPDNAAMKLVAFKYKNIIDIMHNYMEYKEKYLLYKLHMMEIDNVLTAESEDDFLDYQHGYNALRNTYDKEFGKYNHPDCEEKLKDMKRMLALYIHKYGELKGSI